MAVVAVPVHREGRPVRPQRQRRGHDLVRVPLLRIGMVEDALADLRALARRADSLAVAVARPGERRYPLTDRARVAGDRPDCFGRPVHGDALRDDSGHGWALLFSRSTLRCATFERLDAGLAFHRFTAGPVSPARDPGRPAHAPWGSTSRFAPSSSRISCNRSGSDVRCDYDAAIEEKLAEGKEGDDLFFEIAIEDLREAADPALPDPRAHARARRLGLARGLAPARRRRRQHPACRRRPLSAR